MLPDRPELADDRRSPARLGAMHWLVLVRSEQAMLSLPPEQQVLEPLLTWVRW